MASVTQTPISATTGTSVMVLPADSLRRFLMIQIYTTSAGTGFLAFGQPATAGTAGEYQLVVGSTISFGVTPPAVISPDATYTVAAPPVGSVNIIGGSGTVTGSILSIDG